MYRSRKNRVKMMNINYNSSLRVKYDVDVFVAGGGPAGVAAAVSAARQGASVFLAEISGSFGGAATRALVPAFMQFDDGINFLAGGIGKEVYDYIQNHVEDEFKEYCPPNIPVEVLKLCYDEMMTEAGVKFEFFTMVTDIIKEEKNLNYAICCAKGEKYAVKAKVFIDCTGDGDMAFYAGAEYVQGDEEGNTMAATLCALWNGMEWDKRVTPDNRCMEAAYADGVFPVLDKHLPGMWPISKTIGGSNAGHVYGLDGTIAEDLTKGMLAGRKQLLNYRRYYREYLSGFEKVEMVISAEQIGIRETRRILCDYVLDLEDFKNRASFEDGIGRYAYPVDIHASNSSQEAYKKFVEEIETFKYEDGESYGIPYRCLTVRGFGNLLVAGRCVSTDRSMQASVRVMPGCYITGQAAGMAAAIAANTNCNVHEVDTKLLREKLQQIGMYL